MGLKLYRNSMITIISMNFWFLACRFWYQCVSVAGTNPALHLLVSDLIGFLMQPRKYGSSTAIL